MIKSVSAYLDENYSVDMKGNLCFLEKMRKCNILEDEQKINFHRWLCGSNETKTNSAQFGLNWKLLQDLYGVCKNNFQDNNCKRFTG